MESIGLVRQQRPLTLGRSPEMQWLVDPEIDPDEFFNSESESEDEDEDKDL